MRIVSFNTENLFLWDEGHQHFKGPVVSSQKAKNKLLGIKETIAELKPDILCLTEIGGEESLLNFNHEYLEDSYTPFIIPGNSDRGIELAFLTRADLKGFRFEHFSHKERSIHFNYQYEEIQNEIQKKKNLPPKFPEHKFSRDISELRVFKNDEDQPSFIILLCHLKSQLDKNGIDPLGRERRTAELKALVEIYLERKELFSNNVPIILTGDFNGHAGPLETSPEFQSLYEKTELCELFEYLKIPNEEQYTFHYFRYGDKRIDLHLDYFFFPEKLKASIIPEESGIYLFKGPGGEEICPPTKKSHAESLPSDHYPIYLTLKDL